MPVAVCPISDKEKEHFLVTTALEPFRLIKDFSEAGVAFITHIAVPLVRNTIITPSHNNRAVHFIGDA